MAKNSSSFSTSLVTWTNTTLVLLPFTPPSSSCPVLPQVSRTIKLYPIRVRVPTSPLHSALMAPKDVCLPRAHTERVCCLLVLNSVTSTQQWIRQSEAAWGSPDQIGVLLSQHTQSRWMGCLCTFDPSWIQLQTESVKCIQNCVKYWYNGVKDGCK